MAVGAVRALGVMTAALLALPAMSVPARSVPARSVPATSIPATSIPYIAAEPPPTQARLPVSAQAQSTTSPLSLVSSGGTTAGSSQRVEYRHPVDRAVSGGFHLEAGQYGAGRRGVEYRTEAGDSVGAVAGGLVTFAGVVAGRASITIAHLDGRRSTVTGLSEVLVGKGDVVVGGQLIARAAPSMILTIREGDLYVDPALFLPARRVRSHLVPQRAWPGAVGSSHAEPLHSSVGPV